MTRNLRLVVARVAFKRGLGKGYVLLLLLNYALLSLDDLELTSFFNALSIEQYRLYQLSQILTRLIAILTTFQIFAHQNS